MDIILGISWLRTLGDVKVNWEKMRMEFEVEDRVVCVQGENSLISMPVSLQSLNKLHELDYVVLI